MINEILNRVGKISVSGPSGEDEVENAPTAKQWWRMGAIPGLRGG
jgi:hypothetical protein